MRSSVSISLWRPADGVKSREYPQVVDVKVGSEVILSKERSEEREQGGKTTSGVYGQRPFTFISI